MKWRLLHCRIVRDNLDRSVESGEQNHRTETQNGSRPPEEPSGSEGENRNKVETENQQPKESWRDLLYRSMLLTQKKSEGEAQIQTTAVCQQVADIDPWPTHLRPFSSQAECHLVTFTYMQLQHSGYYWGPITVEEAHHLLSHTLQGTFLIRDSGQPDVFFTLSYQGDDGPTSVRILLTNQLFSLHGSHRTFVSLFALLSFYISCSCKLRQPYHRQRPELLQQLCRRAVIFTHGSDDIHTLPGINTSTKDYLQDYPYSI